MFFGSSSELMPIKCGVPQGFTLGPYLFLLYIIDLNSVFNKFITAHFADDTHLSYASKSVMNEWLRSNKLSLNYGKPELVIFRSKVKKELNEITIKIKSKLSPVSNVNYFCVVLDRFPSWNAQVNNLCKKNQLKLMVFCPSYVIMYHKRLVFPYICPCFTHLIYTFL